MEWHLNTFFFFESLKYAFVSISAGDNNFYLTLGTGRRRRTLSNFNIPISNYFKRCSLRILKPFHINWHRFQLLRFLLLLLLTIILRFVESNITFNFAFTLYLKGVVSILIEPASLFSFTVTFCVIKEILPLNKGSDKGWSSVWMAE